QRGISERRRVNRAVHHHENIFARPFADITVYIERDAFGVAIRSSFHADEPRVHIVRRGLSHLRQRIGRGAIPGTDADVDTLAQSFLAEIFAPFPAGKVDVDGAVVRIHASIAVAAEHDGPQVTGADFIFANQIETGLTEGIQRKGNIHAIDMSGVQQALHVLAETENRGSLGRLVTANALKDSGAVADNMREHVNGGLVPGNEFSVTPNLFGLGEAHS